MYTREDVLGMAAGEELDALVCEEVMNRLVTWNRAFMYLTDEEKKNGLQSFVSIPEYSTKIAAAWQVVASITDKSERDRCGPFVEIAHDGEWHARIGKAQAMADTAPMAICKAALLSLLKED